MADKSKGAGILDFLRKYAVMITFALISYACFTLSGMQWSVLTMELMGRFTRNAFMILALILPIIVGMGINFAITIGGMAAQIAIFWVMNFKIPGIQGILVAALLTVPIAGIFGYLVGKLLNRMKGQEMIGSMVLGYFANGLYQLLFLFVFGRLIPVGNSDLLIRGGEGVKNTLDLSVSYGIKRSLDNLWKLPFGQALYIFAGVVVVVCVILYIRKQRTLAETLRPAILMAACCAIYQIPAVSAAFVFANVPMVTVMAIACLGLFNVGVMRTRLGQQFRAVGQDPVVANAAGINVNRTRIIAIVLSTIFAGWGQIIYLQNLGTVITYTAHESIGLFSGAAILVGGASIKKATNGQALLGCILFHILFIVAPQAGNKLFGAPDIGEHFRVFMSYGVIALALVMHSWKNHQKSKPGARLA